jgi:signal transduction histidine kinase
MTWETSKFDSDKKLKDLIRQLIQEYQDEELFLFGELRDPRGIIPKLIAYSFAWPW